MTRRCWRPTADKVGVPLTDRQREVLTTFIRLQVERGRPPTHREMCQALELEPSSLYAIMNHYDTLARRGLIVVAKPCPGSRGSRPPYQARVPGLVWVPAFTDDEAGQRLREALGGRLPS